VGAAFEVNEKLNPNQAKLIKERIELLRGYLKNL